MTGPNPNLMSVPIMGPRWSFFSLPASRTICGLRWVCEKVAQARPRLCSGLEDRQFPPPSKVRVECLAALIWGWQDQYNALGRIIRVCTTLGDHRAPAPSPSVRGEGWESLLYAWPGVSPRLAATPEWKKLVDLKRAQLKITLI